MVSLHEVLVVLPGAVRIEQDDLRVLTARFTLEARNWCENRYGKRSVAPVGTASKG